MVILEQFAVNQFSAILIRLQQGGTKYFYAMHLLKCQISGFFFTATDFAIVIH